MESLRQALRLALASGLAWQVSRWLGAERPVFAVLAVLVTMRASPYGSLAKGLERLVGVFAGVALGAAALHVTGVNAASLAALALVTALVGGWLAFGGERNSQVGISALLVVAMGGGVAYGVARAWETAVGGAVAVLVAALIWPPDPVAGMARELDLVRLRLAADVVATAGVLGGSPSRARRILRRVRRHAAAADRAVADLAAADPTIFGLRAPTRRGGEPAALEAALGAMAGLYRHARALARYVVDARTAGCRRGGGALRDAADAFGAACAALASRPGHARRSGAAVWLSVADEALQRYWAQAGVEARCSAPVEAEFRHLLGDLSRALGDRERPPPGQVLAPQAARETGLVPVGVAGPSDPGEGDR